MTMQACISDTDDYAATTMRIATHMAITCTIRTMREHPTAIQHGAPDSFRTITA